MGQGDLRLASEVLVYYKQYFKLCALKLARTILAVKISIEDGREEWIGSDCHGKNVLCRQAVLPVSIWLLISKNRGDRLETWQEPTQHGQDISPFFSIALA